MRTCLCIGLATLLLAGCAETTKSTTTTSTPGKSTTSTTTTTTETADQRTTVSKPPLGGGETGTAGDSSLTTPGAAGATTGNTNTPVRPDNTKVNERDQSETALLPTDQSNDQKDLDTLAEIRRRIVDSKNLSVNGRNVKIITNNGKATLRGPVASEDERKLIEQIAKDVAGPDNVDSHLEVAP